MATEVTEHKKYKKMKQIDLAATKLKESELYNYPHYASLLDDMINYVVPFLNEKFRFCKEFNGILNKKRIVEELEESVPALHFVFKMMNDIVCSHCMKDENALCSIPIVDLCSGKGILSILIVSLIKLVKKYQHFAAYIDSIYLIDGNWDIDYTQIEIEEMKQNKQDWQKKPKSAIKSSHLELLSKEFGIEFVALRTNIHNDAIVRFLNGDNFAQKQSKIIFVAIHLCRRLSVRAIELFNFSKNICSLLLAPCCLPLRGGQNVRIGPLWNKTYDLWSDANKENINVNDKYLVKGIAAYIQEENGKNEKMKHAKEQSCAYHLALMNAKQIRTRNKKIVEKERLSKEDIDKLNECANFKEIETKNNQMFVASEVIPFQIFEYAENERYKQWIGFLFNGIDANDKNKKIWRVPLKGNEHRCDAYLTTQRF